MKTDIKEKKDGYELEIDLPGFKKDEVTAELNDGYLTVSAAKGLDQDEQEKETGKYIRRERYAGACQLPVLLVVWQVCFADTTSWYLVAAVLLLLSALPFFLHLERKPISAREMALLSVLTALAVVSRAVFYLIPQVKPIAAVVIVAGMCLGPFSGYMVGALSAFLSNFLFGQGIWTPFQMVALGLVGLLAGMLLRPGRVNRWVLALVGFFLATVVYGLVVDLSTAFMTVTDFTWPAVLAVYASGAPFDLVFGGSTAVFLVLFGTPLEQKITRLQRKYGLLERKATAGDKENCHE